MTRKGGRQEKGHPLNTDKHVPILDCWKNPGWHSLRLVLCRCILSICSHHVLRVAGRYDIHCILTQSRPCCSSVIHITKGTSSTFLISRPIFLSFKTRRALGGAKVPPTKVFWWLTGSVNKTIVKPCVAAVANTYTSNFPDVKFRVSALIFDSGESSRGGRVYKRLWLSGRWITSPYNHVTCSIVEKAIRFRHPDYNPDRVKS